MAYGPDNSKPLNEHQIGWIKVPPGRRAKFTFSSNAYWENAACIYPESSAEKIYEAGNYDRTPNMQKGFITNLNNSSTEESYRVTGWHKQDKPNHRLPWIQSSIKRLDPHQISLSYGFEDAGGDDYDDMIVNVEIID